MQRTRVKICGITRPEDAAAAADAGADAIGLVFYPPSPRAVDIDRARAIAAAVSPFVTLVGLFVDEDAARIRAVLDAVPLDVLQFHGDEAPEDCRGFGRRYIKALPMETGTDLVAVAARYPDAAALLVDTPSEALRGGTGQTFDWSRLPASVPRPLILAGGLNPDNVADAVARVRPHAVDVSSGVESAKGIKDAAAVAAFIRGASSVTTG